LTLPSFSQEDIYNSLSLLVEEGYITVRGNKNIAPRRMIIEGITLKGHEFLAASKNDSVWKKTLESVKSKGGGITLEVLKQLQ
jgi:DNA-binding PadR family transcriptional regulator